MALSSFSMQDLIDECRLYPETQSALPGSPGSVWKPAFQMGNRVMRAILQPAFNWKWNRTFMPKFLSVALQQDYVTNVTDCAWVESGQGIDVNNTANPKPIYQVRAVRDLPPTWWQGSAQAQLFTWIPNRQATMWAWLPSTAIAGGYGTAQTPVSPIQQFTDVNNNILYIDSSSLNLSIQSTGVSGSTIALPSGSYASGTFASNANPCVFTVSASAVLPTGTIINITGGTLGWTGINSSFKVTQLSGTTYSIPVDSTSFGSFFGGGVTASYTTGPYGTTGTSQPKASASAAAGTLVVDGTVVWTVADPEAYAIRFVPVPPNGGVCYLYDLWYQKKPPKFTSASQKLTPIPDEMYDLFLQGFIAFARENSTDPKARSKAGEDQVKWLELVKAKLISFDREPTETAVVPGSSFDSRGGGVGNWQGGCLPWQSNFPSGAGNVYDF